jgi:hypothetical protein
MSKQTAVDWLLEQMKSRPMTIIELDDIFYQAKKLEREQIEDAYLNGTIQFANDAEIINPKTSTDYYEQTYGGQHDPN